MASQQTLSDDDRRLLAAWAADCAEHVLGIFESAASADDRPRAAIARARSYARGELSTAEAIRRRFVGGAAAAEVTAPAARAAARAAGQAAATCHLGAHALGAAAYAIEAVALASDDHAASVTRETRLVLARMPPPVREALRALPPVGEDRSGPLGPGLLASGHVGAIIRGIQAGLAADLPASEASPGRASQG